MSFNFMAAVTICSNFTLLIGDSVSSYIIWGNNTWVWVDDKD